MQVQIIQHGEHMTFDIWNMWLPVEVWYVLKFYEE